MNSHLLPLLAAALASGATWAQDFGPSTGDREITLAGTGTSNDDFDDHTLGITGTFGWYVTDNWEINLRQTFDYTDVAGDNDVWSGSTRIGADFHFDLARWQPYLGANIGAAYGDGVPETGMAAPELGVKYYVKPQTFIFYEAEYQFFFESADEVDEAFDNGIFVHAIGVGFNF